MATRAKFDPLTSTSWANKLPGETYVQTQLRIGNRTQAIARAFRSCAKRGIDPLKLFQVTVSQVEGAFRDVEYTSSFWLNDIVSLTASGWINPDKAAEMIVYQKCDKHKDIRDVLWAMPHVPPLKEMVRAHHGFMAAVREKIIYGKSSPSHSRHDYHWEELYLIRRELPDLMPDDTVRECVGDVGAEIVREVTAAETWRAPPPFKMSLIRTLPEAREVKIVAKVIAS